ncbi:MAG: hypothetical protein JW829_04740 [Pirellulales bacterium]|nr:hypothetical protein [Pirellulales bacterium]
MLIVISDLHMTDGTSGATISPGAFHLLAERIADLAMAASYRVDGNYRPLEQIDLLLLGDVLDVIRSTRWLEGRARPWDTPHSMEVVDKIAAITNDILKQNEIGISVLRALAEGSIRIPPANRFARPAAMTENIPVPVRIHYMVGNHDWFFHLPGEPYDRLRQKIAGQMGLVTTPSSPFPHEPFESEILHTSLRRHAVFARHGDLYDPFNYEGDRDGSSLGDAIVIELLNRFGRQIELEMADDLPPSTCWGLREIDNIRPLLLIPVWIDGLLARTCPQPSMRKAVKKVWDMLADEFLELAFVRTRDTWRPNDLVDGLQRALKFSRALSVGWASAITKWICRMRGMPDASYAPHALTEQEFRNRRARHIIYGHTHRPETVPLDASYTEGYALNQIYFNSGTWRRVHEQTQLAPAEHEFIASDTLTYLAFFQGDERKGRPYETWTGTLGLAPADISTFRVDPGVSEYAAGQSISAPSGSLRGPHFTTSVDHATTPARS